MSDVPTRLCSKCGEVKDLATGFYRGMRRGKLQYKAWCKECRRALYHAHRAKDPRHYLDIWHARRRRKAEHMNAIKVGRGCAECGFNAHPAALDWHHKDPSQKSEGVAILVGKNARWSLVEDEMAKCEVLCANCHRIRHANERAADKAARSA